MSKITEMMKLCQAYYTPETMMHAYRVATLSVDMLRNSPYLTTIDTEDIYLLGLAHDLLEDTDCLKEDIEKIFDGEKLMTALKILTKSDGTSYEDYIKNIFDENHYNIRAIIVKKADMKDHLMQLDTLTPRLIQKYIPVLQYFL